MLGVQNISRRAFLKTSGIAGAVVLSANIVPDPFFAVARAQTNGRSVRPNLFVGIADDGTVTITCQILTRCQSASSSTFVL